MAINPSKNIVMEKIAWSSLLVAAFILPAPFCLFGQQRQGLQPGQQSSADNSNPPKQQHSIGFGIMAGFNFSNVNNASDIGASSRTGYNLGLFLAPSSRSILGSRTELVYSRHGYNYGHDSSAASGTTSGSLDLDYILFAQYLAINITKYVQIHLGIQTSYLLHAKADSSSQQVNGNPEAASILSYFNRFDYGFGGGVEIHPFKGLVAGGRYSISLNNLYKLPSSSGSGGSGSGTSPSFVPGMGSINLKNNLVQLYIGYRF
jgi:opacity protein-like surface antigen